MRPLPLPVFLKSPAQITHSLKKNMYYAGQSLIGYRQRKRERSWWFFLLALATIPLIILGKKKPEISLLLATGFITLNSTFA